MSVPVQRGHGDEARCGCGHLVAKLRRTGVELKCKRCKRLVVIPYQVMAGSQYSETWSMERSSG